MTSWYIGINKGENLNQDGVDVGTSSVATDVEVRMDDGKTLSKQDVLLALKYLEMYIESNGIPSGNIGVDIPPK